jgi:hypothetical protein
MLDFPNTPTLNQVFSFWQWDGQKWIMNVTSGPTSGNNVPIVFPFAGKPIAGSLITVPMDIPLAVPAGLAGTTVYATSLAGAGANFTFNKISGGSTTPLGVCTITPVSHTSCNLTGAGGSLAPGDTLQLVAPATQDANLADVGITLLTLRI